MKIKFTKKVIVSKSHERIDKEIRKIVSDSFDVYGDYTQYKALAEKELETNVEFKNSILGYDYSDGIDYESFDFIKNEINSKQRYNDEKQPIYDYNIEIILKSVNYDCLSINSDKTFIVYKEGDGEIKFIKAGKEITAYYSE